MHWSFSGWLSDQVVVWRVRVKRMSSSPISGVPRFHLHDLHAFSQSHVLKGGAVRTFPSLEAIYKPPESLLAKDIARTPTHVPLLDEWGKPSAKVHWLFWVVFGQGVAKILHDNIGVVVCFQEPVCFIKVVLMDVLEGSDGFPVQLLPSLTHIQANCGEVCLHRAHVQNFVTALRPCGTDVLGPGL